MSKVSTTELARFAVDRIESGAPRNEVSTQIAAYLIDERRTRDLTVVMRAIEEELMRRGSEQVVITSARSVSEETKKQLAKLLGAKNPVFSEIIDKDVIGGVKAQAGEKQIDLTIRGKLQSFQSKIIGA